MGGKKGKGTGGGGGGGGTPRIRIHRTHFKSSSSSGGQNLTFTTPLAPHRHSRAPTDRLTDRSTTAPLEGPIPSYVKTPKRKKKNMYQIHRPTRIYDSPHCPPRGRIHYTEKENQHINTKETPDPEEDEE